MNPAFTQRGLSTSRKSTGFSLVELMVAMTLGMILVYAFTTVYLSSRTASRRVEQLSAIQQSVRMAFDFLTSDAHSVGMMGCYTGVGPLISNSTAPAARDLTNNYGPWVEGYDAGAAPTYPLTATNVAANWQTNATPTATAGSGRGIDTIPFTTLGTPLTTGSDVLVLRSIVGRPLRLLADLNPAVTPNQFLVEAQAVGGTCTTNNAVNKISGLCTNSHALIANCTQGRAVQVASVNAAGAVTLSGAGLAGAANFAQATTEVFPLQTVVYYVRPAARTGTQSLYRRIYDGDDGAAGTGEEQELIEDVENLQMTYGIDNVTTNPDGVTPDLTVDAYVTANAVTDWSRVVAVRMSLLVRAREQVGSDVSVPASAPVNGVTVNFPTTGARFDRRVYTTTVALRNRVAF
jgi:type IV pilus assembly protein PilW